MTRIDPFDFVGKVAIVTGAGRGLGRAIAIGLANAGAKVMVAGRTDADIRGTADLIAARGGEAAAFQFDAAKAEDCAALAQATIARFGVLDSIVVNHGVTLHCSAFDTTADGFRQVVDVNLTSAFLCAQAAGRVMRSAGGTIVLISSNASIVAFDGLVAYSSSKGGVDQLCRQLAGEWAPHGIRVNAIGPGYMNSHMRGTEAEYEDEAFKRQLALKIPAGRRGNPEELVGPVLFFASGASSYVTGQYLAVDGGYTII
jgi:NAD(P)-dependent dehydrogenase (short-subunit alcohol dehydrogenase family)